MALLNETGLAHLVKIIKNKLNLKVDKADGKGLSSNDYTDDEKAKLESLENYDDKQIKNDIAMNTSSVGMSRKNLLQYKFVSGNAAGVSVSVSSDGTVTLSGTTTTSLTYNLNFPTPLTFDRDVYIIGATSLTSINYHCKVDTKINNSLYPAIGTKGLLIPAGTAIEYLYFQQTTAGTTVSATIQPMICYADIVDKSYEPYQDDLQTQISKNDNDISIHQSSIGMNKKNLLNWARAEWLNVSGAVSVTKTNTDISITSNNLPWASASYKLPNLKIGTEYILSVIISDFSTNASDNPGVVRIRLSYDYGGNSNGGNIIITGDGKYNLRFTPTSEIMYILFYPNFSSDNYTNSFNASDIMLRYADITDDTYEPYRDDLQTQVANTNLAMMGTKNILYNGVFGSFTYNGITYTRNDDGSITISGVNTESSHKIAIWNIQLGTESQHYFGNSSYGYDYTKHIPTGKYIMSLGVDTTNKLKLQFASCKTYNIDESSITIQATSNSNEITVEEDDVYNYCRLIVYGGADFSEPVTIYPMIRPIYVSDDKYVIGRKSLLTAINTTNREDIDINRSTLGYYKKNLIKPTLVSETQAGVTCTTNSDGSVTVTGKNSSDKSLFFIIVSSGNLSLNINEQYVLSGTPYNNTDADGNLMAHLRIEKPGYVVTSQTDTVEKKFNVYESTEDMFMTLIVSKYGDFTDNPLTFYPMIRLNSIEDNTYEPYAPSVQEQLDTTKNNIALNTSSIGMSKKNLLGLSHGTKTSEGVTCTINNDGSVTLSGTNTSSETIVFRYDVNIPITAGDYILTGRDSLPVGTGEIRVTIDDTIHKGVIGGTLCQVNSNSTITQFSVWVWANKSVDYTLYPMLRYADITDDTYEPYQDDLQTQITKNDNDIAIQQSSIGMSKKNLLKPVSTISETKNGITVTRNSDGSFVVNTVDEGATATDFFILGNIQLSANITYKLTGGYSGNCSLKFDNPNIFDIGNGLLYTPTADNADKIVLRVAQGTILDNITIYPMIRYADITDDTYEPYVDDLQTQITKANNVIALNKSALGFTKKNVLRMTAKSQTINGITFTVNEDNSVTVNGTATAKANLDYETTLQQGEYILSGIDSPTASTVNIGIYNRNTWKSIIALDSSNDGRFNITSDVLPIVVRLVVYSGYTVENVTFYPMVRYTDIIDDTYEPYTPPLVDNITTNRITTGTNDYCVFKFTSTNRFSAKFLICGNSTTSYGDIFVNVCFGTARIKKYIASDDITVSVIIGNSDEIYVVIKGGQYWTVSYTGTVLAQHVYAYSTNTVPEGTILELTEL